MRFFVAIVFALAVTGALLSLPFWQTSPVDIKRFAPQDELALTERYVDALRAGRFDAASAMMDRTYRPKNPAVFVRMRALFPKTPLEQVVLIGWAGYGHDPSGQATRLNALYDFGAGGAVQAQFLLIRDPVGLKVGGVNFRFVPALALHANAFRLPAGALDIRWFYLGVAALFDIFAFATFVLCLASPVVRWRWRWLWAILVLIGGVKFNLDWVSLASNLQTLFVAVPPAGFFRYSAYGSWVLSIAMPVGAAIYWAMRTQWQSEAASQPKDLRTI